MAQWQHKLDLSDFYHDEALTIAEKGKRVAARIRATLAKCDEALDIADQFEEVEDVEEFDGCMEELYDWGDSETEFSRLMRVWPPHKLCWIDTFPKSVLTPEQEQLT